MLYHMPHIATAQLLNSSALPHAPQVDDDTSPSWVQRGLRAATRAITPLLDKRAH